MSFAEVGDDLDSLSSGTGVETGLVVDWGCNISPNGSKAKRKRVLSITISKRKSAFVVYSYIYSHIKY